MKVHIRVYRTFIHIQHWMILTTHPDPCHYLHFYWYLPGFPEPRTSAPSVSYRCLPYCLSLIHRFLILVLIVHILRNILIRISLHFVLHIFRLSSLTSYLPAYFMLLQLVLYCTPYNYRLQIFIVSSRERAGSLFSVLTPAVLQKKPLEMIQMVLSSHWGRVDQENPAISKLSCDIWLYVVTVGRSFWKTTF